MEGFLLCVVRRLGEVGGRRVHLLPIVQRADGDAITLRELFLVEAELRRDISRFEL